MDEPQESRGVEIGTIFQVSDMGGRDRLGCLIVHGRYVDTSKFHMKGYTHCV